MLNKQKGNMFNFVTHTWNAIKGKCPHNCSYCYMKVFKNLGELRLDEKSLKDNLGENNFIFVGSSVDMFAKEVPSEWILRVLEYCRKFSKNKYLFQTKNPKRFQELRYLKVFPKNCILGTTLESNRNYKIGKAPSPQDRARAMYLGDEPIMISVEPILDFDLEIFSGMITTLQLEFVSIGADSKGHNLPEPPKEKVEQLIKELQRFTKVIIKKNLNRILK